MGGFDTHENQAIANKPSFGGHGCLLYHLSEAMHAFQEDLKGLGLEDRVLTFTFSEFGRQVAENGTYGTDHGSSAPVMVFGKGINPGVTGINPNLSNIQNNRLVGFDHDYRSILATILRDWFGANYGTQDVVGFYDESADILDLINGNYIDNNGNTIDFKADTSCDPTPDLDPPSGTGGPTNIRQLEADLVKLNISPNPATSEIQLKVKVDKLMPATLSFYSINGQWIRDEHLQLFTGDNSKKLLVSDLASGTYLLVLTANKGSAFSARHLGKNQIGDKIITTLYV